MDDTGWHADGASDDASATWSPHDDTAPQPVVGHDGLPHHHEAGAHVHEGPLTDRLSAPGHHAAAPVPGAIPLPLGPLTTLLHDHDQGDGGPHHTDEPRFNALALAAGAVVAVVALVAVAGFGLLRSSDDSAAAAAPTSTPPPASALLTPPAAGAPDATATGTAAMLPPSQPTLVLGDSLGLVVYPYLADQLPDRYVSYESEVGRSTPDTAKKLTTLSSIPPVVIVSSGTNDGYAAVVEESARKILDKLGAQRCVVWVDVVRPDTIGDSPEALNAAIGRATAGRPNVRVLKWSAMVAAHPEWMAGDGIHPNEEGAKARSEAFAAAAASCSPIDPTAPTAKQQVLPQSIFWGPISSQYTGSTKGSGNGGSSTRTSAPSSSRTSSSPKPSSSPSSSSSRPSASSTPSTPDPPPPSSTPATASPTAVAGGSAAPSTS